MALSLPPMALWLVVQAWRMSGCQWSTKLYCGVISLLCKWVMFLIWIHIAFTTEILNAPSTLQVSHTLLSLIDEETNQPFPDVKRRLAIFTKMLQSAIPPNFNWVQQPPLPRQLAHVSSGNGKTNYGICILGPLKYWKIIWNANIIFVEYELLCFYPW